MAYINGVETMFSARIGSGLTVDEIRELCFPVGITINCDTSPAQWVGGTWEQIKDKFLLAAGDTYKDGSTGGSADAVVVSHNHKVIWENGEQEFSAYGSGTGTGASFFNAEYNTSANDRWRILTENTGVDGTGKNMPPYIAVNTWKRIA